MRRMPCVLGRLVECVSKHQQQKVPRVSGWVRVSDQSACVAMQRRSCVSTANNKQRVPHVSAGIRVLDRKERTTIRVSDVTRVSGSVCRTACVATNQPAEREGVGPSEEKECRDCGGCFHG